MLSDVIFMRCYKILVITQPLLSIELHVGWIIMIFKHHNDFKSNNLLTTLTAINDL